MTKEDITNICASLDKCYNQIKRYCDFDCFTCEYGVMNKQSNGYICGIELIRDNFKYDKRLMFNND